MSDNSDDFQKPHNISIPQGNSDDTDDNYGEEDASGSTVGLDSDDNVLD